jgi:ubiquitin-conjugating enzyme E2 variant
VAASAGLLLLALPPARDALDGNSLARAFLCSFLGLGAAANQLHGWAHAARVPAPVRWAQRLGLVLSPRRHARHHRAPHGSDYCIATGWLNPVLDGVGLWRRLERRISALCGARPRSGPDAERVA